MTVKKKQVFSSNLLPKFLVALKRLCYTLESEVFVIVFPLSIS